MKKTEKRNGVTALDRAVFHIVEKYAFEVCLIVILGISLYARIVMIPNCVLSSDYNNFIVPWVNKYRELGIVNGLAAKVGDYYVPYNVLLAIIAQLPFEPYLPISVVHVTAEYLGAYFLFKTVSLVLDEKQGKTVSATAHRRNLKMAAVIAVGTLFLPSVLMNASLWKQCDSLYTCAIIISLYLVLSRRYTAGFLIYAFGLCLKLQAVFFLPFLVILYLSRKDFSIFEFFWIPFMYVLTGLPAVICGRRFQDVYKTYLTATGEYDGMAINSANFYQLGLYDYPGLHRTATAVCIAIFGFAALYIIHKAAMMNLERWLYLASWVVWTAFMFLPAMHERYDYAAIILISAFTWMRRKQIYVSLVLIISSVVTYSNAVLGGSNVPMTFMALLCVAAYAAYTVQGVRELSGQQYD